MGKSIAAVSNTRLFLCVLAAGHCGLFAPSIHHARSQNCLLFCGGIRFRLLLGAKAETKKKIALQVFMLFLTGIGDSLFFSGKLCIRICVRAPTATQLWHPPAFLT